ncbi:hypothetical protein [Pantoea septica]|uniref:hypothetical protein n=1 Tax=Pantoea septica TaxID=472695 RepID=UPI003CFC46DB
MEKRRVPTGFRILTGVLIFIFSFLLVRPSDPVTGWQKYFWFKLADIFGQYDVEGFTGISILLFCFSTTLIGYKVTIWLIERKLNR